jgi:NAD(P)-dependent dehydrogenase (short-subunit alcohol dehydrogenase family)
VDEEEQIHCMLHIGIRLSMVTQTNTRRKKGRFMTGKIIIYGGSGGIGSVTARMLNDRGCDLHLVGRSEEKLCAIASELNAGFTVGDVGDSRLCDLSRGRLDHRADNRR